MTDSVDAMSLGADREVLAAVAEPYAPDRKLTATDSVRLEWKDPNRKREIPLKVYFPVDDAGPFPVIVFSHGLGGTREGYEYLGRQWAAHGYVSIHIQHIGSDDAVWRGQARPFEALQKAVTNQNSLDRDRDVKFVIDQLAELNQSDPKLKSRLDLTSIGMAGHSYGAETTLLIAGQVPGGAAGAAVARLGLDLSDRRVKAAIAMSKAAPQDRSNLDAMFAGVRIPIFFMTGTADDSPLGDTRATERRIPYDHIKNTPAYLLTLTGGDHMVFSGRPLPKPTDDAMQRLTGIATTAFWDAHLKSDADARHWVDGDAFKQLLNNEATLEQKR